MKKITKNVLALALALVLVLGMASISFAKVDQTSDYQYGIINDFLAGSRTLNQKAAHEVYKATEQDAVATTKAVEIVKAGVEVEEAVEAVEAVVVEEVEAAVKTVQAKTVVKAETKVNKEITEWQQGILQDFMSGHRSLAQKPAHDVTRAN